MSEFITVVVGFAVTSLLGFIVIPWLKALKAGQSIKEIGPTWHKYKEGTPIMGGLMFMAGTLIALVTGLTIAASKGESDFSQVSFRIIVNFIMCLAYSLVGFSDDFIKIKEKHNDGITVKQKLVLQMIIAAVYVVLMVRFNGGDTSADIPFLGRVEFGWFYYPLMVFCIVGITNAVNLTDGLDGLASSVTVVVAIGFAIICGFMNRDSDGMFCYALMGSLLGFLIWNFKPAKVFMGDTGSMFLGGTVVAMSYGVSFEALMLLSGILYVCEAFSVIIQVTYFKLTHGKRIFKMSPIHHHYEMCGWSEEKIIFVFSLVAAIGTGLSVWAAYIR